MRPGMKVDRDGLVPQRLHMRQGRVGPHHDGLRDEGRPQRHNAAPTGTGLGAAHLPPLTGIEGGRRLRFEGRILPEGRHLAWIGFQRAVRLPGRLREEHHLKTLLGEQPGLLGDEPRKVKDGLIGNTRDGGHRHDSLCCRTWGEP